ncbi:MAG: glutaredoxin 3 [Sneathiella sp.]|jgi:glutaredoxin 3|uniref:glutaredoxin 3 n=1 Tax=Sneathiella sp. TaxID=1964365 RepID=UPI000C57FCAC|nr:glutaredoxin 3 [Sneathiella sp.]MAL78443.1 glutaredoxin 3 [Sneathiella sp.]|tara:strand:+ start:275 stop:535 length:261 start_codon:yes stop_codon:yes gene_type:complete
MKRIEIYTTMFCPYCARAKKLLKEKGVDYQEIDVTVAGDLREEMTKRAHGAYTVPQIFIDGEHLGDSDYLHKLDADGKLDQILGIA